MAMGISCLPGQKAKFQAGDDPNLFFCKFNERDISRLAKILAYCHQHDLVPDECELLVNRMLGEGKDPYMSTWLSIVDAYETHTEGNGNG